MPHPTFLNANEDVPCTGFQLVEWSAQAASVAMLTNDTRYMDCKKIVGCQLRLAYMIFTGRSGVRWDL